MIGLDLRNIMIRVQVGLDGLDLPGKTIGRDMGMGPAREQRQQRGLGRVRPLFSEHGPHDGSTGL
eukprot:693067-Lingulodinium_polyedra.AAC.1